MQSVVGGEERIKEITKRMPDGYREGHGTEAISALALTLNSIGIPAKANFVPDVSAYLAGGNFPAIGHIEWPDGKGHYAVAVKQTVFSKERVFLDPFYALVQLPQAIGNSYRVLSGVLASGIAARGILSGYIVEIR